MKTSASLKLVSPFVLALTAACSGPASLPPKTESCPNTTVSVATPPVTASVPTGSGGTLEERQHLFDDLVAKVRRYHVFSPHTEANLGHGWDPLLPALKAEFERADTREKLVVALFHLNASIHDMHSRFRGGDRGKAISLGFRLGAELHGEELSMYVESVRAPALKSELREGDILISADGVPVSQMLHTYETESEQNSWPNIALDITRFLTRRKIVRTSVHEGDKSILVVKSRDTGAERTVTATWKIPEDAPAGDINLPFGTGDCADGDPKDYGPYQMAYRGEKVCIYLSTDPAHRDYPIVRHTSYHYQDVPQGPLADYELIQRALASVHPKGVLLDVQDNGGGINPNVFLDWWADKPYTDTFTRLRFDETFSKKDTLLDLVDNLPPPVVSSYLEAWKAHKDGEAFAPARPFQCTETSCDWDNRYTPKHRITQAPVALLSGPGCGSSCDAFSYQFAKSHLGPIVGRPGMSGYTTHRAHFPVRFGEKNDELGTFTVAVSYDTPQGSDDSIEGVPVHLDVPVPMTWENHAHYDRELVEKGIEALKKGK